jgi:hypothetical protein
MGPVTYKQVWKYNIKMDVKETAGELGMDLFNLAQGAAVGFY